MNETILNRIENLRQVMQKSIFQHSSYPVATPITVSISPTFGSAENGFRVSMARQVL